MTYDEVKQVTRKFVTELVERETDLGHIANAFEEFADSLHRVNAGDAKDLQEVLRLPAAED